MMGYSLWTFILLSFLAFPGDGTFFRDDRFTELCESAVKVYLLGADLLVPPTLVSKVEKEAANVKNTAKNMIKTFASSLKEMATFKLPDKMFAEILRLTNETYHQLPHKKGDDYYKNFVALFEDVTSWFFLFFSSFRKLAENGFSLTQRSASDAEGFAKNVCKAVQPPPEMDLSNPGNWAGAVRSIMGQLTSYLNSTGTLMTQFDNILIDASANESLSEKNLSVQFI